MLHKNRWILVPMLRMGMPFLDALCLILYMSESIVARSLIYNLCEFFNTRNPKMGFNY